jgi:hypothetical protein
VLSLAVPLWEPVLEPDGTISIVGKDAEIEHTKRRLRYRRRG